MVNDEQLQNDADKIKKHFDDEDFDITKGKPPKTPPTKKEQPEKEEKKDEK